MLTGSLVTTGAISAGDAYPAIGPLPAKKAPSADVAAMGKRLFFDARISGDGAVSCAFCHDPAKGFGDGMALSEAYPGTNYFRNAPTLINVRYKADFADTGWAWDGRLGANLNDVVRDQLTETTIMNMDMRIMHERMKQDPVYVQMCEKNYGGDCSSGKARKALVAFMETLVSNDAPFDTGKMSSDAKKGKKLFTGKAGCISCHNGPYFSDGKPHNTGVPEDLEIFRDPVRHLTYRSVLHTYGVPNMAAWRRDVGYFMVSRQYQDVGKFITPTLRELNYTAPYMHNGSVATLKDVIDYYDKGGNADDPMPSELKPLDLSRKEKKYLLAFLQSLSSVTPVTVDKMEIPQDYAPIENWLEVKN
ncbi:MAG: c-type cytochrome [Halieaceae bacterium]|nr:c-type cytochrome [Halieaceae bacterium]